MKKNTITLLTLLAAAPLLSHCASQTDVNNLNYQLRVVNKKVEDMRNGSVDQMQVRQAASTSQLDEIQQEIGILKNQVDELTNFNRMLKEQNKELETSLSTYSSKMQSDLESERAALQAQQQEKDQRILDLENQLNQKQDSLKSIQQSRLEDAQRKAESAAQAAEAARRKAELAGTSYSNVDGTIRADRKKMLLGETPSATFRGADTATTLPSTSSTLSAPPVADTPERAVVSQPVEPSVSTPPPASDLFGTAENAYVNGNYKDAYDQYAKYLEKNKSGDKAINATFMMGECLFALKNYNQAIIEYQKVVTDYPGKTLTATALLKQAMSFEKISDFETAKILYRKILSAHPSSPEATQAKERSARLK